MNYKKKYKEALEKARKLCDVADTFTSYDINTIFPELKENEDERIKFLIKSCVYASGITPKGREEIFAWIEKQGKTLDPDKVIEWINNQACLGFIEDIEV